MDFTEQDWELISECIGCKARDELRRAGYSSQPCVGSVHDSIREVGALLQKLADVEAKVVRERHKLSPAPF